MKKLSLKNLKLEASDMLQRNQLKTVFGGYGGRHGLCSCKTNGSITYEGYVGDCNYCDTVCTYSNPSHTSLICSGA